MAERPVAILIAGPTAGGKSALALEFAARTGGAIVNADSMQVYRELSILTARPSPEELAAAQHLLYGQVPASAQWSVAHWLAGARSTLGALVAEGRTAIFTGGTGLYFKALLEGISAMPPPDAQVREHWRRQGLVAPQTLHAELARRDPEGAHRIEPGDRQRLVRALEVFDTTGLPIGHYQEEGERHSILAGLSIDKIIVEPDREVLHRRIGERVDRMIAAGALDEVKALLGLGLPCEAPAMKAIGVSQLAAALSGTISIGDATELLKAATRQYAKRQSTWFRHQLGADWTRQA